MAPSSATKDGSNVVGTKTRRKLQKNGSRQRQASLRRGSGESTPNKHHTVDTALTTAATTAHPSIPLPPDLSDSKWLEYIRKSGFLFTDVESPLRSRGAPTLPISPHGNDSKRKPPPELSHLATSATRQHQQHQQQNPDPDPDPDHRHQHGEMARRGSIGADPAWVEEESDGSASHSSESSRESKSTSSRRRAKTPVFMVGQLEKVEAEREKRRSRLVMMQKPPDNDSVEAIAEQYRKLLESRASYFTDSQSEPLPPPSPQMRRQRSSADLRRQSLIQEQEGPPPLLSPHSDDGTLVSFEEETIYFKPMSFSSPEPTSPLRACRRRGSGAGVSPTPPVSNVHVGSPVASPTPPENLSLQICLDFLTRELASGMSERPYRQSADTSALQIWVMIEAYERLKGTVLDTMALQPEEARRMHSIFDTWLGALSALHDSMKARDKGEYDKLEDGLF